MIAVISCPAKRKLGKVTGTDNDAARFIRKIHEHLRALPGLTVLVRDVVVLHILSDVLKMLCHARADIHFHERCMQRLRKRQCIVVGAVCRPESRHCNCLYVLP